MCVWVSHRWGVLGMLPWRRRKWLGVKNICLLQIKQELKILWGPPSVWVVVIKWYKHKYKLAPVQILTWLWTVCGCDQCDKTSLNEKHKPVNPTNKNLTKYLHEMRAYPSIFNLQEAMEYVNSHHVRLFGYHNHNQCTKSSCQICQSSQSQSM